MRTIVISILFFVLGTSSVFAQEAKKIRTGLDIGGLQTHQDFGILSALELKYNLQNNMNIGLKVEYTYYTECMCNWGNIFSFATTYDYFFHSSGRHSSPFIGAGLGYYFCKAHDHHFFYVENYVSKYNNPTCFIRAGFEIRKFRMTLSYNLIRKPSEMNPSDRNRDYISLTVGVYFGGGKWK